MLKGEQQVELAMLRMQLRGIDAEVAALREESRRYRQMRFGLDIKEIQLTALQDQRDACAQRIAELHDRLRIKTRRRPHPLAWLLLPVALWLDFQSRRAMRTAASRTATAWPAPERAGARVSVVRREPVAIGAGR